jgi:hypothetical protein
MGAFSMLIGALSKALRLQETHSAVVPVSLQVA